MAKDLARDTDFREDLYDLLTNAGYDFDFVGSLTGGSGFDADHEGHSGFFTQTINLSITNVGSG